MPILFAPLVGLLLGITLAWISRERLGRPGTPLLEPDADRAPLTTCAAMALLVFLPVVIQSLAYHGDWAYLYLVPEARVPSAVDLALVLLSLGSVAAGFAWAAPHARSGRLERAAKVAIVPVVLLLVLALVFGRRLSTLATYAQYHGDFGRVAVGKSALGRSILIGWLALATGIGWAAWRLRHDVTE